MKVYATEYKQKLTTPQKAVEKIKNGDTLVHGATISEPPALLSAIADRVREGNLKDIKIYSRVYRNTSAPAMVRSLLPDQ